MAEAKQLKIKTGVARRLQKELAAYTKELDVERARTDKMREGGADPSDLKHQVRVLARVYTCVGRWRGGGASVFPLPER